MLDPIHGRAVCARTNPDVFFPESGEGAAAKKLCAACPVRDACLALALDRRERFGVWGGKSERERREILKQRGIDLDAEDDTEIVVAYDDIRRCAWCYEPLERQPGERRYLWLARTTCGASHSALLRWQHEREAVA